MFEGYYNTPLHWTGNYLIQFLLMVAVDWFEQCLWERSPASYHCSTTAIYGCEVSELNRLAVAYETTKIPYLPLAIYLRIKQQTNLNSNSFSYFILLRLRTYNKQYIVSSFCRHLECSVCVCHLVVSNLVRCYCTFAFCKTWTYNSKLPLYFSS